VEIFRVNRRPLMVETMRSNFSAKQQKTITG